MKNLRLVPETDPPNQQREEVTKIAREFGTWAVRQPDQIAVEIRKTELAGQLRDMGVDRGIAILKSAIKAAQQEAVDQANRKLLDELKVQATAEEEKRQDPKVQKVAARILKAPDIVREMLKVTNDLGHVGEETGRSLLFLSMVAGLTARTHEDAIHVIVKGASSSGKNAVVKSVLQLLPTGRSLVLTNTTHLGLVYVGHAFPVLVFQEVEGVKGAEYMVRQIMSEGVLRRIRKPEFLGDDGVRQVVFRTSVITTTTRAHINPENETRAFSIQVSSDPELTHRVLMAEAKTAAGFNRPTIDDSRLLGWHEALARLQGGRVVNPFAEDLAKTFPIKHVRARRDFLRLLNLMRASALLHQNTRKRTRDGHVVATQADRKIVEPIIESVMGKPEDDLSLTAQGDNVLKLIQELGAATADGWVDRTALVEAASQREIASGRTVQEWCKQFVREGVCEPRARGGRLQYRLRTHKEV